MLQISQSSLGSGNTEASKSSLTIRVFLPPGPGMIFKVKASGHPTDIVMIAQQPAWLSANFRTPDYGRTPFSEVRFCSENEVFKISPMALEEVSDVVGACWVPLFVNGVIARGFPIPKRHGEQGIELPFAVMASLAKTMYPVYAAGVFI